MGANLSPNHYREFLKKNLAQLSKKIFNIKEDKDIRVNIDETSHFMLFTY